MIWTLAPITSIAALLTLTACGVFIDHDDDSGPEDAPPPVETGPTVFEGFVGGAFEVSVDGSRYRDMEDFYTQEVARLPEKVRLAGYDASWQARFDAAVGLEDLWRDMQVYISPVASLGYQDQSYVDAGGRFAFTLPPAALGRDYKVRATKRIGIVMTRGETERRICYNFSAVEMSAPFADATLPIVLDTFETAVTAYACSAAAGGLNIPSGSVRETTLAFGQTKADVTRIVGIEGLVVESPLAWCWAFRPRADSPCAADVQETDCDCRVRFSEVGLVSALEGLAPSYTQSP